MASMADAERTVRLMVSEAELGARLGTIASVRQATGLSASAALEIMRRFIAQGLVRSERGPRGGYWRTYAPMPSSNVLEEVRVIAGAIEELSARLHALANSVAPAAAEHALGSSSAPDSRSGGSRRSQVRFAPRRIP